MASRFLLVLGLFLAGTAAAQIEPDSLLTIPHILRTPLISDFAASPDGKRIALSLSVLGKETIWMVGDGDTPGSPIATQKSWGERDVDWSPDGRSIAFVSTRDGGWHVYLSDPDGQHPRQLTHHDGEDRTPRFSPDGKHVAFLSRGSTTDTGWDLWVVDTQGGVSRRLTNEPFDEEDPRWSPDGKRIAIALNGGRYQDRAVAFVNFDDGAVHPLTPEDWPGDSFGARFSPDGSRVAFVSDHTGLKTVFLIEPDGKAPVPLLTSEYEMSEPAWSPDGQKLAYLENQQGDVKLKLHDFGSSRERTLTLRAGVHSRPAWRPDGSAVWSLFEAWNYPRDLWAYSIEGGRERVSDTLPPDVDVRKTVKPELVRYRSLDNREITGYLYLPETASAETPAKLLVRPVSGLESQWMNKWYPFVQLLAQKGYAIFTPNVRGASGFGREFEKLNDGDWGRGDLDDLVVGTRQVAARPEIRGDRIGIWGVHYGGFLALAAIVRYPDFFACAVETGGMPDLEKLYRQTSDEGRRYLESELGPLRGNLQLYRDLSPIQGVGSVKTPLLSFHGETHPLVPYSSKEPFLEALRARPDYPLLDFVFRGEEMRGATRHDLYPEAAWAYVEKILEFLEIYL
ncbi:MAG TPA: prolyl oligopeptidase family serine peptidase [Vicinamibacteria bacterium]|nr:prolyl oligopeptidase family serine peptidase [Vicinamibacteria bacterium]